MTGSEAWGIVSRIIAGLLLYGGAGWVVGLLFGAANVGLAIGSLVGIGLATYTTIVRVSSLNDSGLPIASQTGTAWTKRMTQIRVRNAKETSE